MNDTNRSYLFYFVAAFSVITLLVSTNAFRQPAAYAQTTNSPVTITDNNFEGWSVQENIVNYQDTTDKYTVTLVEESDGSFYREIEHRLPYENQMSTNLVASVGLFHFNQNDLYIPASQGGINYISYAEQGYVANEPHPNPAVDSYLVVQQGGVIYRTREAVTYSTVGIWENRELDYLRSADFTRIDGQWGTPDFTLTGSPIRFGFYREHSRSRFYPPLPTNEEVVYQHRIGSWSVTIYQTDAPLPEQPPIAKHDYTIGETRKDGEAMNPYILAPLHNDWDPNGDPLTLLSVSGSESNAISIFQNFIRYSANKIRFDPFKYTVSDGKSSTIGAFDFYLDCGCAARCLDNIGPTNARNQTAAPASDGLDLLLIYDVRDQLMRGTQHGNRYIDIYYNTTPELLRTLLITQPQLGAEAVEVTVLWQDNLRSLVDGDGQAVITAEQVDALSIFLTKLASVGSADLRTLIQQELEQLGPLEEYIGLTMAEAAPLVLGQSNTIYLPMVGTP